MPQVTTRSRRSCLSVPGSSERMLAKAPGLAADHVLLDLEDAVAPAAKAAARANVVATLREDLWPGTVRTVRVNDVTTAWAYRDVVEVVEGAGANMKSLTVGEQPPGYDVGDAYHHVLMRILTAARAHDLQAIDGPFLQVRDVEGFARVARRSAALGFDGKWVLDPDQIETANEVYAPSQDDYDHAELILDAYEHATSDAGGARGAVMLGEEMIDEASRKMALTIAAKGRAAGLRRTKSFEAPA